MEERWKSKFPAFPFKPYSIQIDFMDALYDSLSKGGIAMLESPTGTGKTLSIICSALQWLVDRRQQEKSKSDLSSNLNQTPNGDTCLDDEPDWMRNFVASQSVNEPEKKTKQQKRFGVGPTKLDGRVKEYRFNDIFNHSVEENDVRDSKVEKLKIRIDAEEMDDEAFLVDDYESDDELGGQSKRKAGGVCVRSSSDEEGEDGFSSEQSDAGQKIYFCSRTHSQLSQFIKELRKTCFSNELNVVCLGSRKNLCINAEVSKLGNSTRINERCLELQTSKGNDVSKMKNVGSRGRIRRTKAASGCPMLRKHKMQKHFMHEITQEEPLDIEDLVYLGKKLGTCPYYGSRNMIPAADLVVLPYQSLLSKSSREALGLDLKNNIVVIDEAHNLADCLISMYDSKITLSQLEHLHSYLGGYFQRFFSLLGPGNRRYIQTLLVLTRAFLQILCHSDSASYIQSSCNPKDVSETKCRSDSSMTINEFLFSLNVDNINLVKLLTYIKESNIIHKVSGYGDKADGFHKPSLSVDVAENNDEGSALSGFRALADILMSLTYKNDDGRIIISRIKATSSGRQEGFLKYVMLTGEKIFSEIVDDAYAVVLAGGTLQPIEETRERLFPWLAPHDMSFFSCGHIVPPENILPVAVSRGPTGRSFDFSYGFRSSAVIIEELGLLVCNLVSVVPEGIIVFFASFDYEGQVYDAWEASGVLARIMKKKRIFREPRRNTDVEVVLKEYKETIDALSKASTKENDSPCTGAIILAVVGGKISEGINFSDGMGRCIVVVGLPYPSPSDIELIERVKHIEHLENRDSSGTCKVADNECHNGDVQSGFNVLRSCKNRGKEYYENLCMKAVNQSIGRAIRHLNDYAAILLVDGRYASDSSKRSFSHPTNKLPNWIKGSLIASTKNYGEVHRLLHQFFRLDRRTGQKHSSSS